jgi:hypothetical protein
MFTRALLLVLGLFHVANGLAMLVAPAAWAVSVVHDPQPSHLEFHFIADIGMAFLASGAALVWSARPALHALIHVHEWLTHGLPATTADILNEGIGVILAGLTGVLLASLRQREGVSR